MGSTANQLSLYNSYLYDVRELPGYIIILAADNTINQSKSRTDNSDFYKL